MYTIYTDLLKKHNVVDKTEFTPEEFEPYKVQYEELWEQIHNPPAPPPYIPTAEEVANNHIQRLKSMRNSSESASPFVFEGNAFDYDPLSRERINAAVSGATIAALTGAPLETPTVLWTLADNGQKEMTIADWIAFKQAEITRSAACHAKYNEKKQKINDYLLSEEPLEMKKTAILSVNWEEEARVFGNDA